MKNNKLFGALTIALLLNAWSLQGMNKAESPKKIKVSNSPLDDMFTKKSEYGLLFNDDLCKGAVVEHQYDSNTGTVTDTYVVKKFETFNAKPSVSLHYYNFEYADYLINLLKQPAANESPDVGTNDNRQYQRVIYATNIGLKPLDKGNRLERQGKPITNLIPQLGMPLVNVASTSFAMDGEMDLFDYAPLPNGSSVIIPEDEQSRNTILTLQKKIQPKGRTCTVKDDTNVQGVGLLTKEDQRTITLVSHGHQKVIDQNKIYRTVKNFSKLVTLKQVRQADLPKYGKYSILETTDRTAQEYGEPYIAKEPTHLTYGLIGAAVATAVVGVAWKLYSLFKAS